MTPLLPLSSSRPGFVRTAVTVLLTAGAVPLLALARGAERPTAVAPGVTVRSATWGLGRVRVVEVDLWEPGVRLEVAAEDLAFRRGVVSGRARTLPDWLSTRGAVAGVNGGFFGQSVGPEHKEIVGLLKLRGRVRSAAPALRARGSGTRYAHAALGLDGAGAPRVDWVTSLTGDPQRLFRHPAPELGSRRAPWGVREAVACGPQLLRDGRVQVTDRQERLVSRGALPRTFLGYAEERGRPRRVLLCAADGMEFRDCAAFLRRAMQERFGLACRAGMALDGGGSTQAAWRHGGRVRSGPGAETTVPTALLVHARPPR